MYPKISITIICIASLLSCNDHANEALEVIPTGEPSEAIQQYTGQYFGLEPTSEPQILGEHFISTSLGEYNGTFSADGNEFYYTTDAAGIGYIIFTELDEQGNWTVPEIASFSGEYSEYDPLFTPDGSRLYFSSERPLPEPSEWPMSNIWYVDRIDTGWSDPIHVPLTGNGDYFSSVTNNGTIYFNCWNSGKILKAFQTDSGYVTTELPEVINHTDCGDPFISPNEDYLIYRAYYDNDYGKGDLYISFNINDKWTAPENLGESINSNGREICPYVTTDEKLFIYASSQIREPYSNESLDALVQKSQTPDNGQSNIYYMSADFIGEMKAKHLE